MEETKKFPRFDPLGWARRHKKRTALILVLVLAAALVLRGFLFQSAPTSQAISLCAPPRCRKAALPTA